MEFAVFHFIPEKYENICSALQLFKEHERWKENDIKTVGLEFGASNYNESKEVPFIFTHITSLFARIFRKHCCTKPHGNSVFDLKQQLLALQLVMAQKNKKFTGEFTVAAKEVLEVHDKITESKLHLIGNDDSTAFLTDYNEFLLNCNAIDYADVVQKVEFCFSQDDNVRELYQTGFQYIIVGTPETLVEAYMLKLLLGHKKVICPDNGNFVVNSVEELASGKCQLSHVNANRETMASPPRQNIVNILLSPKEVQKSQILQMMLSYLRLLVNTRDELALSQVVNVPCRGLGRKEFTAIRKLARKKNMMMYQTAVSFILQVRLGGKSYAPPSDHPFFSFTKGLAEFVAYFQKLQNMLEETPCPEDAVLKVINSVRTSLIKAKEKQFQTEMINEVSQVLQQKLRIIAQRQHEIDRQEARNCKLVGAETISLIQNLLDDNLCQINRFSDRVCELYCVLSTPDAHGPSKLHSVITQFRTPDLSCAEISPSQKAKESPKKEKKKHQKIDESKRMCGEMSWAKPAVNIGFIQHTNSLKSNEDTGGNTHEPLVISPNRGKCSETPKSRSRKRPRESACDKENVLPREIEKDAFSGAKKDVGSPRKPLAKRLMLHKDNTVTKNKKNKTSKPGRTIKKGTTLLPGQKQMTQFFRV